VWEREIYSANFILVHSTLSYIQFPKQPLGSISNHSQITPYTTTKRWSWNHKNHSSSLQAHTFSQNNLWLYRISIQLQVYERTITRIMKGTDYTWVYKNQKAPMIKPGTSAQLFNNLVKLLKNFFQNQSQSHCVWFQTSIFFKRKAIFIALKVSRSRQH